MPKLGPDQVPSYRLHRQSGHAIVTLSGRDILLGAHNTRASRDRYNQVIAEWIANGRQLRAEPAAMTIVMLAKAYWTHCLTYYPGESGRGERQSIKLAINVLRRLYAREDDRVAEFGPLKLKAVRQAMVDGGWCRTYVNAQVGRIRRMFAWGVENEIVPPSVLHGLQAVAGLRSGKCAARESEPVRPVPEPFVTAALDHASQQVKAMIELQLLTGMRPGEVCSIRTGQIDTTGKLWTYKPATHKTQHYGHERTIYLGPKAQSVLGPLLKPDLQAFVFSPADAEAHRRERMHAERLRNGTPLSCGNRPGTNRVRNPGRKPGDVYTVTAYRRAIERACDRAFPPPAPLAQGQDETRAAWRPRLTKEQKAELRTWRREHRWHPHQLRHNAATRLRKDYGLEAAQVILGHRTLAVTEIYAEKNVAAAMRIMGEVG